MSGTRARLVAGVLLLGVFAVHTQAQTLEVFAGGKRFNESPALETPVWPGRVTTGPDGRLYLVSRSGEGILRLDTASGTATLLPEDSALEPFKNIWDIAFGADGSLFAFRHSRIVRLDLMTGEEEGFSGSVDGGGVPRNCSGSPWSPPSYGQQSNFVGSPDGNLYLADANANWVCAISSWGNSWRAVGTGGWGGFGGDGGPAEYAALSWPTAVATDAAGNLYVSDTGNHRVRKVTIADGIITTIAGTGDWTFNGDGIPATTANVGDPGALAVDAAGNVFVWDGGNRRVRRIDAVTGMISTVAGNGDWGFSGDGGPATNAAFSEIISITIAANGDLYLSDHENKRLRRVAFDTGIITTVLGNGENNFCGEAAQRLETCLNFPQGVAVNAQGDVFISDAGNLRVRRVSGATDILDTIAGRSGYEPTSGDGGPASAATFGNTLGGLALDMAGNLYIAGWWEQRVQRIDAASGIITTIAGTGEAGNSGDGGLATLARLNLPSQLAIDAAGNVYVSEGNGNRIRRIDANSGVITTVAGTGLSNGPLGDGAPAALASLANPGALGFDAAGHLLIVDTGHARIRKIDLNTGIITTIAGNGSWNVDGNGGPASAAGLGSVGAMAIVAGGNIYLAGNSALRRIDAASGIIDSVPPGWSGLATINGVTMESPRQMAFDAQGRLYVADNDRDVIWRIDGLPQPVSDSTPPVITPQVTGTAGDDGWYRGNVQISWSVTDAGSVVSSSSGCGADTVTSDTGGVTFTCTATSDGGTATGSVTLKRDATPPSVEFGAPSPAPDATGWNNSTVSIPFITTDATSGVRGVSMASPLVFESDGADMFQQVSVTDQAGNVATFESPRVNIDRTPPTVQPQVAGTLGDNGWYTSDVLVSWSIDDVPSSVVGCDAESVTADTTGVTFSCSVTSAGGTGSSSITVKRDATAPVLTFGTPSPTPNAGGWNRTNVSIPFTRSDALSGVASTSAVSPLVIANEGAGVTGQVVVTDLAGNSATFTSVPRNIDKTAPVVTITTPAAGATYGFYQDVIADFECSDVSPVTCTAPTADGEYVNTRTAGARTLTVTARDASSFTTSVSRAFTVEPQFNFEGFLAPMSEPPTLNLVARGALVPIRWRLLDGRGGFVTNPASFMSAKVGSLSCGSAPSVPLNDTAVGPEGLSFDPTSNTFTYNWQTNANWTGCYVLTVKLKDNVSHQLRFRFQ